MKLWAVFQEGVYRHSCGGIYDSEAVAITAADRIAAADVDDYHEYEVVPFTLNQNDEGGKLYSVNRKQALEKLGPHTGECEVDAKAWRRNRSDCSRGTRACVRDGAAPDKSEEKTR
jgi:hypothetical protein